MTAKFSAVANRHSDDCDIHHRPSIFQFLIASVIPDEQKNSSGKFVASGLYSDILRAGYLSVKKGGNTEEFLRPQIFFLAKTFLKTIKR